MLCCYDDYIQIFNSLGPDVFGIYLDFRKKYNLLCSMKQLQLFRFRVVLLVKHIGSI